jgi:hypothetical protein
MEFNDSHAYTISLNNKESLEESLNKLEENNNFHNKYPVWRRSLLISLISCILISVITNFKLNIEVLLIIFICNHYVVYHAMNFYNYHYYNKNSEVANKIINNIRKNLKS